MPVRTVAIVGRPNVGKSTLFNRLAGKRLALVDDRPGVTRDRREGEASLLGLDFRVIDTAGFENEDPVSLPGRMRQQTEAAVRDADVALFMIDAREGLTPLDEEIGRWLRTESTPVIVVANKVERLSANDTRRAIDYAEVVVLLLDATRGLEAQDLRIASQVIEEGRALLIALNKWDVAENASALFNGVKAALDEGLAQLRDVPVLTVSAITGKGTDTILKVAFDLREAWSRRVTTGELNRWFEAAVEANPPPAPKGQRIKLRYITQVKSRPPTFVVFGNRTDELPESYRRYLVNALRRDVGLGAVPLRLSFRGRANPFDKARR